METKKGRPANPPDKRQDNIIRFGLSDAQILTVDRRVMETGCNSRAEYFRRLHLIDEGHPLDGWSSDGNGNVICGTPRVGIPGAAQ